MRKERKREGGREREAGTGEERECRTIHRVAVKKIRKRKTINLYPCFFLITNNLS